MSSYPLLEPSETLLEGKWEYTSKKMIADDTCRRIEFLKDFLDKIAITDDGWSALYKDPQDGRYWELSYPDGSLHGGGAPALKCLDSDAVMQKYSVT